MKYGEPVKLKVLIDDNGKYYSISSDSIVDIENSMFVLENVSQGGKTDMDFAKEIAIERGCSVWVENNTLVVMPYVLSESSVQLAYRKNLLSVRATYNGVGNDFKYRVCTAIHAV